MLPLTTGKVVRKILQLALQPQHLNNPRHISFIRHTFATLAMQSGVDAKTLASMLGHYSAGFTLDTYTHVTHQMQQGAAADKIGGFMEGVAATIPEPEPPEPIPENECKILPFAQAM